MPRQTLQLRFPTGGVRKRAAYQQSSPYYTPDALNVRPDDVLLGRERGGSRPGLGKFSATQLSGAANPIRLIYEPQYADSGSYAKQLLASANGMLFKESGGTFSSISGTALVSDRQLTATDILGIFYFSSDASGNILKYEPPSGTVAPITASAGTAPTNCRVILRYRNRLFACHDTGNPHRYYASRQENPLDWDYTQGDQQAAFAGHLADAGTLEDPIITAAPHGDDCLVIFCTTSVWTMRSDIGYNGHVDNLSRAIGCVGTHAWCNDSEGNLYFLSHDGLYWIPEGCGGDKPMSVSRESMPEELLNVDRDSQTVSMAYDVYARGIHLFVSNNDESTGSHWFIDLKVQDRGDRSGPWGSFWPQSFVEDHVAQYVYSRPDSPLADSVVLIGGRDGYLRNFDKTLAQDDGSNNYDSYYYVGPFPLAGPGRSGQIAKLELVTAANSGDVDAALQVGLNAEAAFAAAASQTHAFNAAGWNPPVYPRLRGTACCIKVQNGGDNEKWSVEEVVIDRQNAGMRRG